MKALKSMFLAMMLGVAALTNAQMPEASAEVKALDWMLGEWSATVKWTMMGTEADAQMTWKAERDGLFLKRSTTTELMGMKMTEVSYSGWDEKKKKYWTHVFTNFAPGPRTETGEQKGDVFVSVSEPWDTGSGSEPTTGRITYTKKGEDILYTLEFKMADKWEKVAEGTFKKKKA